MRTLHPHIRQMMAFGAMRFSDVKALLLDGLRKNGWTVHEDLKVPHATKDNTRLWFKSQAIYMNDLGRDYRDFGKQKPRY